MKKLHPLAFAALTLPLILAACGTASTPTASAPSNAKLVKLSLHAPAGLAGLKAAGSIKSLGLPTDPTNAIPALHFDVHVRDGNGKLVAFNDGTYDPSGAGSTTLVLNSQNAFGQTLLLPEGSYTFENAVKDDLASSTLLAYGPATENGFAVSGDQSMVMLKFHAVYNPTTSTLDFGTNTAHLFTDTSFNLNLFAKSSMVNGTSYRIPTTDLSAVTYTLGSATDGILNGAGSKLGVNLTAVGTPSDSTLDVTASFSAWIQDRSGDTASYQPTTLNFSKAIETNIMGADTVMPVLGFNAVAPATVNQAMTLTGTATDDQMVGSIKLYDNLTLVASSDSDDGVAAVTSDASGAWSTDWTPTKAGSHDLTVVVADSSGNETHSTKTVVATVQNYDHQLNWANRDGYDYVDYTIAANSESIVKVDTNGYTGSIYTYVYARSTGNISGIVATYGPNATDQTPFNNGTSYYVYDFPSNLPVYYIKVKNTNAFPFDVQVYSSQN